MRTDVLVYVAHLAFWLIFAAGDFRARRSFRKHPPAANALFSSAPPLTAPRGRTLILLHMAAFAAMYLGIERALFVGPLIHSSLLQRLLATMLISFGALLMYSARAVFASWRFRAQIEPGHRLATTGPFRFIRHPMYLGLDLLALGTAVWLPTTLVWLGALLMAIAGDLRARAEEPLLSRAFGDEYRAYRQRTWRFVPGIY